MTEDQLKRLLEEAAEKGSEKALEKLTNQVYQEVGKTVMRKFLQALGVLIVGLVIWAVQHGWIK